MPAYRNGSENLDTYFVPMVTLWQCLVIGGRPMARGERQVWFRGSVEFPSWN